MVSRARVHGTLRVAGKAWDEDRSQKLADHIFVHTQEAEGDEEKENRKWGEAINPQSHPQRHSSPSNAVSPKGSITPHRVPPAGDEVFKCVSLLRIFLIQ